MKDRILESIDSLPKHRKDSIAASTIVCFACGIGIAFAIVIAIVCRIVK